MNVTKLLGLAAVGGLLMLAAPTAQAVSLSSPGAAAATMQDGSQKLTTEVRWGRRGGWHRGHRWHRRCWRCR
jgi:Spy/CpxP family protein refolding chaperone